MKLYSKFNVINKSKNLIEFRVFQKPNVSSYIFDRHKKQHGEFLPWLFNWTSDNNHATSADYSSEVKEWDA
jgi:hypothetical protein